MSDETLRDQFLPRLHDDPGDDGEDVTTAAAKPADAIAVTIEAILRGELSTIVARLRRGEPLAVVIVPTSADWCKHLAKELQKAIVGKGATAAIFGEPPLLLARTDGTARTSVRDEDSNRVVSNLSKGMCVVGISHAPEACLPPALLRAADMIVRLPPLSGKSLRRIILKTTGERPGRLRDDLAGSVSLEDIATCIRPGSSGREAVQRLEAARAVRARTRSIAAPPLERLEGYGSAKEWGLTLVREIKRYRAGEIGLSDLPRGLLLSGPPGCGKTLYAQALAVSSGLPIVATSAAKWLSSGEGHLGDALKALRADFEAAHALIPCIVFVDEIDAIVDPAKDGKHGRNWWMSFRAGLLASVDGASTEPGVILIGACNHASLVDGALRRAGRLDRHIEISPPDPSALAAILRTILGGELAGEDLAPLGQLAAGSSAAEMARAVRDARAMARDEGRALSIADLRAAIAPPEHRAPDRLRKVALHEAAHAVIAHVLGHHVDRVSIVSTSDTEGRMTMRPPTSLTRAVVAETVMIALAGRAADTILGAGPCAGASGDLAQATLLLVKARSCWGLGDTLVSIEEGEAHRLLSFDRVLRDEIGRELDDLWTRTLALVRLNANAVTMLAEALVVERVIGRDRLVSLLGKALGTGASDRHAKRRRRAEGIRD